MLKAQCLDAFTRILPDRDIEKPLRYSKIAAGGDFFVVASFEFDTTGYYDAGAAFIYKSSAGGWKYVATLTPSSPVQGSRFGSSVEIDSLGRTIVVSGTSEANGQTTVYAFRMGATGWTNMTESEKIALPQSNSQASPVALSKEGLALAIGETLGPAAGGEAWLYERLTLADNFSASPGFHFSTPVNAGGFGYSIAITRASIVIGAESYKGIGGSLYVYDRIKSSGYPLRTMLRINAKQTSFGTSIHATDNLIMSAGLGFSADSTQGFNGLYAFVKSNGQQWTDTIKAKFIRYNSTPEKPLNTLAYAILNDSTIGVSFSWAFTIPVHATAEFGVIELVTSGNKRWDQSQVTVLFEEDLPDDLQSYGSFGGSIAWTGSQLLVTPTLDAKGSARPNAITYLTFNSGTWSSALKIEGPGVNSNGFHFGNAIALSHNNLLVGSPDDAEGGMNAGAVGIYAKNSLMNWQKIGKILPPPDHMVEDTEFGTSIAVYDSVLAVTATRYEYPDYHTGDYTSSGKVFIYKRTGIDWSAPTLIQTVQGPGTFYFYGNGIAITSSLLVISGQDFADGGNGSNENAFVIYKRSKSGFSYFQTVQFPGFLLHSSSQPTLIVRNDTIITYSGSGAGTDGCYIFAKNSAGLWTQLSTFKLPAFHTSATIPSLQQISLAEDQDHIFIGLPSAEIGNSPEAGAVVVYAKIPGTAWPSGDINPSAILTPKDTVTAHFFGYAVSVKDNILLVGATGNNFSSRDFAVPTPASAGAVYTFMGLDYAWKNYQQLTKFQGVDGSEPVNDLFGYAVLADSGNFFIGAPFESDANGGRSGAVYTLAPPPQIHPVGPICKSTAPITMRAYPPGGRWSGVGITDPIAGVFDPTPLDTGVYTIAYTLPSCPIASKMTVHLIYAKPVVPMSPSIVIMCPLNSTTIQIQPLAGALYQWFFEKLNSSVYLPLPGENTPALVADQQGDYYCQVIQGKCSNSSPVTHVGFDLTTATTGPQLVVCDLSKSVLLVSNPAGGTWSGAYVQNNGFNPNGLTAGKYPVIYSFRNASGCPFSLRDTVIVAAIPPVVISNLPINFCQNGSFEIDAMPQTDNVIYSWSYRKSPSQSWEVVASGGSGPTFTLSGYYQATATNKFCSGVSNVLLIQRDSTFIIANSPGDSVLKICQSQQVELQALATIDGDFEWMMSESKNGTYASVGNGPSIFVSSSGFYKVIGTTPYCTASSNPQQVIQQPKDSLWLPNVFTPDGDGPNDFFKPKNDAKTSLSLIVNRWGDEVYRASQLHWDGGDSPPGTYFYSVTYTDCLGGSFRQKGYVQLVR